MKRLSFVIRSTALVAATAFNIATHAADTSTNEEASLTVYSVRLTRSTDVRNKFGGRIYSSDGQGVQLQLLLKLKNGTITTPGRDAIAIETFIDDTYQSLLGNSRDTSSYGGNQPVVSDDGSSLLFTVTSSRAPADDAGRVFVRGNVETRIVRGEPKVETAKLPLKVGQEVMVGPFRTTLRSISDSENGGNMSLNLAVQDDVSRILRVRVLDADGTGKVLNDSRQSRFSESGNRSVYLSLRGAATDAVTLEFTYAEKSDLVGIPFEAQVDIGVTKVGPIETHEDKPAKQRGGPRQRTWPPPRRSEKDEALPSRRAAFAPQAEPPKTGGKLGKVAVDLFSLTIAKPPPDEAPKVHWNTPLRPSCTPAVLPSLA